MPKQIEIKINSSTRKGINHECVVEDMVMQGLMTELE